jgi:hypothetical protein
MATCRLDQIAMKQGSSPSLSTMRFSPSRPFPLTVERVHQAGEECQPTDDDPGLCPLPTAGRRRRDGGRARFLQHVIDDGGGDERAPCSRFSAGRRLAEGVLQPAEMHHDFRGWRHGSAAGERLLYLRRDGSSGLGVGFRAQFEFGRFEAAFGFFGALLRLDCSFPLSVDDALSFLFDDPAALLHVRYHAGERFFGVAAAAQFNVDMSSRHLDLTAGET